MSSLLQNLLIILGLVLVAGLGYYLYTQNDATTLSGGGDVVANQAALESAEFLSRLNELKGVNLDSSLFSDPRFQSLENYTPSLRSVSVGRANPFEDTN